MDEPHYEYERPVIEIKYNFLSISSEKHIRKRIIFTTSDFQDIYNLALVDVLEDGSLSDITESRNRDMNKIMATVISVIDDFFQEYPDKIVLFRGSDERRQRLYRLIIGRELVKIQNKFIILGGIEDAQPETLQANSSYDYFLILKAT